MDLRISTEKTNCYTLQHIHDGIQKMPTRTLVMKTQNTTWKHVITEKGLTIICSSEVEYGFRL